MEYCFQLIPHANIRYQESLETLAKAELGCMLNALNVHAEIHAMSIGGSSFLSIESEGELTEDKLCRLSRHSALLLLCERKDGWLRPMETRALPYLTRDLSEVLKYKGKTSATFTRMMINCAHAASSFFMKDAPLTVLDPICGKATTCFCALERGWNAIGIDVDAPALQEADRYFARHLQMHRIKHQRTPGSLTVNGRGVPEIAYTLADTPDHYRQKDTRFLRLYHADAAGAGMLLRRQKAQLLVGDLPYGVQHAPSDGRRTEPFAQMLRRVAPVWRDCLDDGGTMALSFNTYTLPRARLTQIVREAGFEPLEEEPYHNFEHFVEQAVNRDFVVARKN